MEKHDASANAEELDEFDEEYVTQFFQFTPKFFINDVYSIISDSTADAIESFEKQLCKEFSAVIDAEKANKASSQLMETATSRMEATVDKLEDYLMKKIFHIPKNVLLPEDEAYRKLEKYKVSSKKLDKVMEKQIQKIKTLKYMSAQLEQQLVELDSLHCEHDRISELMICSDQKFGKETEALEIAKEECVNLSSQLNLLEEYSPSIF